ncbi:hypothetical protein J6590_032276 [Homalodisca vitripennis]|nr:hypothetical protein J6590_032276 [Homalodisca vitripennis]
MNSDSMGTEHKPKPHQTHLRVRDWQQLKPIAIKGNGLLIDWGINCTSYKLIAFSLFPCLFLTRVVSFSNCSMY